MGISLIINQSHFKQTHYNMTKQKNKSTKKFKSGTNYSKFWMDDMFGDSATRFAGIGTASSSTDIVKVIKLNSYRRAIANFVNILTKKDIPVRFAGPTSYTDGKSVTISTDIKDNNFDVSVGLALHEASHILLTDFNYLSKKEQERGFEYKNWDLWKDLVNWIEDRRIDQYVFSTSPGYKAYYHKMYDYYWNNKSISKGLKSSTYRDPSQVDSWMFHIINSLNPDADRNALPELGTILDLINVGNIKRLNSVDEVGEIAVEITKIINKYTQSQGGQDDNSERTGQGDGGEEEEEREEMTPSEALEVGEQLKKQRKFLSGETGKKKADNKLNRKLEKMENDKVDVQAVGEGKTRTNCLIYDLTGDEYMAKVADVSAKYMASRGNPSTRPGEVSAMQEELRALKENLPDGFGIARISDEYTAAIQRGYDMGGLLGKKLQVRNETRDLVYNRMRTGHIDNKRLSQAGFGVETVFKQIHTDFYKKANLHISLDGSGSMGGDKWKNTLQMTMAIVRAATYVQNLSVSVDIRITTSSGRGTIPVLVHIYNSKVNKPQHIQNILKHFAPSSMTPEGLCFEAMLARKGYKASSSDTDSYFLNISDGEPGGCGAYESLDAVGHTKKQIQKMQRDLNMGIIAFFVCPDHYATSGKIDEMRAMKYFRMMYGPKAGHVMASDMLKIAKQMNEVFLEKAGR